MNRYLTILRIFWSASISAEMEYRVNFIMAAFSSVMMLGGTGLVLSLLYGQDYRMGGWELLDALAVVGAFTFIEGVQAAFMTPNRTRITELIREGTLDFVLLKPVDSQFWLSVRSVSLWGVPNIVLGLALLVYVLVARETPPSVLGVVLAGLTLGLAVLMLYSLGYILSTFTIWYIKLYNITMAMQALVETGRYPISAYPTAYRAFFTFVLPVAFMTTVPAQFLTGKGSVLWLVGAVIVAGILLASSILFWRFALRSYTSASS